MKAELLSADNYDEYSSWHFERNQIPVATDIIPATTYFIRDEDGVGVCAGSVYISEGNEIGWISWVVTNPKYDILKRRKAMAYLVKSIEELAKERGCGMLFTSTQNPALGRLYTKAGFLTGDERATHYFRRI